MAKVVTLGEIMLRLSSPGQKRFVQSDTFDVVYGGGEANVAVSLANYGHDAYFVTKLPKHEIGQCALNAVRRYGVNTQFIARGGERLGIYYLESGASMRPSKVVYDRAHSSISEADPSDFDFDKIMEGAQWFHWSGITPAISDKAAELTRLACEAAKRHGVTVSVDLNFRKKLWTSEKAQSIMKPLMKYVDVCIGNEEDAQLCLGFKPDADVEGGKTDAEGYYGIFKGMMQEFGFRAVEFGNWLPNDERQDVIDFAYDSFDQLAEARDVLDRFKSCRYTNSYVVPEDKEALLQDIYRERKKEFLAELDYAWLDMKRLGVEMERTVGGQTFKLNGADDYRYAFPIPTYELENNKEMVQNPEWILND